MNRTFKFATAAALALSLSFAVTGCNRDALSLDDFSREELAATSGRDNVEYDVGFYDNNDYNDYATGGRSTLEGQWPNYGTGDPYVLRFNGRYYLYVSTTTNNGGTTKGILGWKSDDLVHWERCRAEGMEEGYVASSDTPMTEGAYAPEVYYYNGYFYLYESRYMKEANGGEGHYVLRSASPEGPFELVTEQKLDTHIDASVLLDPYENAYFFTGASGYIRVNEMKDMSSIVYTDTHVNNADRMGGWTEGPRCIEYRGKYYLTYTGLHVGTPGYQVCYAVSDGWSQNAALQEIADSFKVGAKQAMLLNADPENGFVGLGHSSSVLGPDLDSYYISYHCLNTRTGPDRSYNLDRILFSGDLMTTHHNRYRSVSPTLPEFYTYDLSGLEREGNMLLSEAESGDVFSAEFNLKGNTKARAVFAFRNAENYGFAEYDLAEKTIRAGKVVNGSEQIAATAPLFKEYDKDAIHTLRIAYRDGKLDLHFDEMSKIRNAEITLGGGKIGYIAGEGLESQYVCFSNVAMGTSDMREIKQALGDTPATAYMREGEIAQVGSYRFREGSGNGTVVSSGEYDGSGEVTLKNTYDYARYLLNFQNGGSYCMELVMKKENCGAPLLVQIDGGEHFLAVTPTAEGAEGDYVRVAVGNFPIAQGIRQIKVQCAGEEISYVSLAFSKVAASDYSLTASLENERVRGMTWADDSEWGFVDGALYSSRGTRNLAIADEKNLKDFEMSVDIALRDADSIFGMIESAGVAFRLRNYASYREQKVNPASGAWNDRYKHVQTYYLSFTATKVTLSRYDFGNAKSKELYSMPLNSQSGVYYTVKVVMRDNRAEIYRNGELLFGFTDTLALNTGACGLYATGAAVNYKNFTVRAI